MRKLDEALDYRFGDARQAPVAEPETTRAWTVMANRGVVRRFLPERLPDATIDTLCALALASPSKSDLQQRDLLIVEDTALRARIDELLADQDWIPQAPHFLIFLGNNRRQRQLHEWREKPFANDHLDAFFNAAVDAGIALAAFVAAAEAAGLGCCPVSVIRNHAAEVSRLLGLPDHVFPVAGLGLGRPERAPFVSQRLPLAATVHRDRFREDGIREMVEVYDARRTAAAPYRAQRDVARWGESEAYGWSEEKARHYARPERADFGAFVRAKGFRLE